MSTLPPNFSVSGALSLGIFRSGGGRSGPDLVLSTRIVDEILGMRRGDDACLQRNLELLRGMAGCDCAFLAQAHPATLQIERITVARADASQARPEGLAGQRLDSIAWLRGCLGPLAVTHITDSMAQEAAHTRAPLTLTDLRLGSILLVCLHVQGEAAALLVLGEPEPRRWEDGVAVLLKLIGTSLTATLERLGLEARHERLKERHELARRCANDGLWDFDVERNEAYFSPRWKAMLGYGEDDMPGTPDWRGLVHPDDLPRVQAGIRDHIAGKTPVFESQHRMRHRNGQWRWVVSRATARTDRHGRLLRLVGVELDITERKIYEEALFREKQSAQITLQSIGDGVVTTDARLIITSINPVAEKLTGWSRADAAGRAVGEVFRAFHEETCEPLENPLAVAMRRIRSIRSVRPMLLIRRDGNELYVENTAAPIRDRQGRVVGGVLVFHDVSESRELNRRLTYNASHDPLTGLANRRELEGRLAQALAAVREGQGACAALCHINIDQFKIVNDTCGHSAGDALLVEVGRLLKSQVRWRDTLARLGGDEFAILLEDTPLDDAMRAADALCDSLRTYRFVWEDRVFRVGASIGLVPISSDSGDVAQALSAADSACTAAKESGRNRVHSFAENDIELMRRRRETQWAARINAALEEGRFELFRMDIQPLQRAEEGIHYEMLVRLKDEGGRLVPPNDFIAAAERYGLTPAIDRWVIENSLQWLVSDHEEQRRLAMCSINLSGQSLGDDKFLPFVIDQLKKSGVACSKICFEITETAAVASIDQANVIIRALRELGCRFALDDFGTGMSSFGYLKHLPVDFLKIDGSFVREILRDPIDREMVRSINEIGHLTGKRTIAEFAENAEIIEMLTTLGIDYAQGYGIAQPQRVLRAAAA